jgi:hypothetical protein
MRRDIVPTEIATAVTSSLWACVAVAGFFVLVS